MTRYLLTFYIVLFFSSHNSIAQRFSMAQWHNGRVILEEGDTLQGKIKYDTQNNVVQLIPEGLSEAYALSAQSIIYFDFTDRLSKNFRRFFSLPYSIMNNNYKTPVLFELLVEGPLTLLTRERVEMQTHSYPMYRTYTRQVLVHDFFFLEEGRKIDQFDGKKKNLSNFVDPFADEVFEFIRQNRLDVDERGDLARAIIYYNHLVETKTRK